MVKQKHRTGAVGQLKPENDSQEAWKSLPKFDSVKGFCCFDPACMGITTCMLQTAPSEGRRMAGVEILGEWGGQRGLELRPLSTVGGSSPTFQPNLHIHHMHPPTINRVVAEVQRHSTCSEQKGKDEYETCRVHQ